MKTKEDNNKEAEMLKEITYVIIDMHGEPHSVVYPEDVKSYATLRSEADRKEIERLKNELRNREADIESYKLTIDLQLMEIESLKSELDRVKEQIQEAIDEVEGEASRSQISDILRKDEK